MLKQQDQKHEEIAKQELDSQNSEINQSQNIYYTQNKKIIFWLYLLLGVIFVAVQITLTSLNWDQMELFSTSDNLYYANQASYQWSQGFINDIKVVSDSECPTDYQHAFQFYWPGTGYGCYCPIDSNNSFVLQGYCSAKLIQTKCVNIKSEQQRTASLWRDGSNICIKRSNVSFLTQEKYDQKLNKLCGNSKSLLVLPVDQPCPIVNISYVLPTLQQNYRLLEDNSSLLKPLYLTYNSTSPYSFYGYPVSKFKVSEYEFCLIDEDSGLDPDHTEFKLLNYEKSCINTSNYHVLDELKQSQFYANNADLNQLQDKIGFPKPGNWEYKLGFANLPSWNYYCRHNYDSKFSIPKTIQIFNFDFFTEYKTISLIEVLVCSALGFQIFILAFRRIMKRQIYPIGYRKEYLRKDYCLSLFRYIIDAICKLTLFGLIAYCTVVSAINWDWFKAAINLQCTDDHEQLRVFVMEPFRDMYTNSIKFTISQLVVIVVVMILDIIHFVYIYKNELTYYLVESQKLKLIKHETEDNLKQFQKYEIENKILNIEDDVEDNKTDKLNITMAFNLYDNQNRQDVPKNKPLKTKRKKKALLKRQQTLQEQATLQISSDFNPYNLEDQSIIGLNSINKFSPSKMLAEQSIQFIGEEELGRKKRQKGKGKKK